MINSQRLADTFRRLAEIDSVSRQEGEICRWLEKRLQQLGARTLVDDAAAKVGGETGNLLAFFEGSDSADPIMLNAHMDTVQPGCGVQVRFADGRFTSAGDTILGADDKSAVAILLEVLRVLKEQEMAHPPLEVVFTVCEEVGLMGAKFLDYSQLQARIGYALDTSGTGVIVTRAPAANRIHWKVQGLDAHAGVEPEKGISAIQIAAKAIAALPLGRIDEETTCNIGTINGGQATNIVPSSVEVTGETRSHNPAQLDRVTAQMVAAFDQAVAAQAPVNGHKASVAHRVESDFPRTEIPLDHPVVVLAQQAGRHLGRPLVPKTTGGGADANIFFEHGIVTGVIGTGMQAMHSIHETITLDDMCHTAELVLEILRRYHALKA